MIGRRWTEWGVSLPSLAWLTLFFVVPTIIVFGIAFHAPSSDGGYAPGFTMETWKAVVRTPYKEIVWRTIWISAATTFLCVVLSLPCAYSIARLPTKWRAAVAGLIMLPFWTSFIVRVFAWRTLLNPEGFLQHILIVLGVADANTTLNYNSGAILVVSVYSFLPFAIMPIYTAAEKFDFSLLEARCKARRCERDSHGVHSRHRLVRDSRSRGRQELGADRQQDLPAHFPRPQSSPRLGARRGDGILGACAACLRGVVAQAPGRARGEAACRGDGTEDGGRRGVVNVLAGVVEWQTRGT